MERNRFHPHIPSGKGQFLDPRSDNSGFLRHWTWFTPLQTGPAKRLLRTMKAVKEGRSLSQRATAALVRLYASEGFPAPDSFRLQPLKFRKDASPAARVVTRSLPVIPELMFVTEDKDPEEVAVLLEETPVVLVVRGQGVEGEMEFVGYLTKAELRGVSHAAILMFQPSAFR